MSNLKDWIVNFSLSEKVQYNTLKDNSDIKFITEGSFLIGFQIIVRGLGQSEAQKEGRSKASVIQELITIESGMAIRVRQTSSEQVGNQYPHVVQKNSTQPYKIEGKIGKLDLNDRIIQKLLKSTLNKNLKFLSDATLLKYYGFNEYSIRESYKVTENAGKTELKYKLLRHLFSHPTLKKSWFDRFDELYGEHYFEYKLYNKDDRKFAIDFESNKTQQKLKKLATDLIVECKGILGLK